MSFRRTLLGLVHISALRLRARHDIIGCKGTSGPLASFDLTLGYHPAYIYASAVRAPMDPGLQLHLLDVMLSERRFHFHVGVTIS